VIFSLFHQLNLALVLKQFIRYVLPFLSAYAFSRILLYCSAKYGNLLSLLLVSKAFSFSLLFYILDICRRLLITKNLSLLMLSAGAWDSKYDTVLFLDSNFHGCMALSIFASFLYLRDLALSRSLERKYIHACTHVVLLSSLAIFLSQSLSTYIALLAMILVFIFHKLLALSPNGLPVPRRAITTLLILYSFLASCFIFFFISNSVVARDALRSVSSIESKIFILDKSLALSSSFQSLLFGVGPQTFQFVGDLSRHHEAHTFMGIFTESGIILFIPLVFIMAKAVPKSFFAYFLLLPIFISYLFALFPLASFALPLSCGYLMLFFSDIGYSGNEHPLEA